MRFDRSNKFNCCDRSLLRVLLFGNFRRGQPGMPIVFLPDQAAEATSQHRVYRSLPIE